MDRSRLAGVGAVAAVILIAAGCGGGGDGEDGSGSEQLSDESTVVVEDTVAGTAAPEETVAPDDAATTSTEFCRLTGGDMEGCFDYDSMDAFYQEGINSITVYIEATFADPAPMVPSEWYFVAEGETGEEPCTMGDEGFAMYTDMSYEYCPTDQAVYVGQRQLWDFYDQAGDAGAVIGIAHEAGHHFQAVAGVTIGTLEESIVMENQADCVAGSFTAWLDSEGRLDYPDDVDDIDVLMTMIASAEEDPMRDHGTLDERVDSFVHGFEQGLVGCNDFFPDTPLLVAP